MRLQKGEGLRCQRLLVVRLAEQEALVTALKTTPEKGIERQSNKRRADAPEREIVQVGTEVSFTTRRVLVVPVPDFIAGSPREPRYVHAVVIDQAQFIAHNQYIAVLEVTMSDTIAVQCYHHVLEGAGELADCRRLAEMVFDERGEALTFHPVHFEHGIPGAFDAHAALDEFEGHGVGQVVGSDKIADGQISLLLVWKMAQEKTYGDLFALTVNSVDAGK